MKALTFTVIAGSTVCPNRCPICISKMTPNFCIEKEEPEVNWEKFEKSITIALNHDVKNVLITGKGEPTLYPGQITRFMIRLKDRNFDKIELQTEGSQLLTKQNIQFLKIWKDLGLETIALSIYHYDDEKNNSMFGRNPESIYNLWDLIWNLEHLGFTVRLSCVLLKGLIDSNEEIINLIDWARNHNIFQLTLREVSMPFDSKDKIVSQFVKDHYVSMKDLRIEESLHAAGGKICDVLSSGAVTWDVKGQNVCTTTGLSSYDPNKEEIRQLIFFPQGWLTTSWENVMGGRIL